MKTNRVKKFEKLVKGKSSDWLDKMLENDDKQIWLEKSTRIAIRILRVLREKKISQVQLAEKLSVSPQQVNKIVKGRENLTLETIVKIESVLGMELINVSGFTSSIRYSVPQVLDLEYTELSEKSLVYSFCNSQYFHEELVFQEEEA